MSDRIHSGSYRGSNRNRAVLDFAIPPFFLHMELEKMGVSWWSSVSTAILLLILELGFASWIFSKMSEEALWGLLALLFGGSWFAAAWLLGDDIPGWGLVAAPIIGVVIGLCWAGWIGTLKGNKAKESAPPSSVKPAILALPPPPPAISATPDPFARWRQRADVRVEPVKPAAHQS